LKILLVFATQSESEILKDIPGLVTGQGSHSFGESMIDVLITGPGGISTSWALCKWFSSHTFPDLVINAGIAGSFTEAFRPGEVVLPVYDCFADMGIEVENRFFSLAEAGLMDPNEFPFEDGWIKADNGYIDKISNLLRKCKGVTVSTSSGSEASIQRITGKFNPDIETMEGATFYYICAMERVPFFAVRAISNMVESGPRTTWKVPLALDNLAKKLNEILIRL
jgi:futalosine hydrolase